MREMVQEEVRFDKLLYFREREMYAYVHVWDTDRMGENSFTGLLQIREFPEAIFTVSRRTSCCYSPLLHFSFLKRFIQEC